jgi:flavin reductase (DIM6/NTAB) family NADH-FMN oxidoreductase RutF
VTDPTAPPEVLDGPLEFAPSESTGRTLYRLLTGLIVPRPIAWVSTTSADGVNNLAPHSYFNLVSADPPHVVISFSRLKDTLRNLRTSGEFVISLVTTDLVEPMNITATDFPAGEDEFRWAGVTPAPSRRVTAPRVAEAPAHLECEVRHELTVGSGHLVVGEITHVHVEPRIWRDGGIDPVQFDPVARLSGNVYARLGELFTLARPRWEELPDRPDQAVIPRRS